MTGLFPVMRKIPWYLFKSQVPGPVFSQYLLILMHLLFVFKISTLQVAKHYLSHVWQILHKTPDVFHLSCTNIKNQF